MKYLHKSIIVQTQQQQSTNNNIIIVIINEQIRLKTFCDYFVV